MKKRKKIKKLITTLLLMMYSILIMGQNVQAIEKDTKNSIATVEKAYFNKSTAKVGEEVIFYVKLKDIKKQVDKVEARFSIDGKEFGKNYLNMNYNKEKDLYYYKFKIDSSLPSGEWNAAVTVLNNNEGGYGTSDIAKLKVTGTNNTINDYIPTIEWIKPNKTSVNRGDIVALEIKVKEKISKVHSMGVAYNDDSGQQVMWLNLYYDSSSKTYKGSQIISTSIKAGKLKVSSINVNTNCGGYDITNTNNIFTQGTITVLNKINPIPEVTSITMDKKTYKSGETIKATVTVKSPRGTGNTIELSYSTEREIIRSDKSTYKGNGKYEVEIKIPYYIESDKYNFMYGSIYDNENKCYISDFYNTDLNVKTEITIQSSGRTEKNPPKFKSIKLNAKIAKPGEKIKVVIDAEENESYINTVVAEFTNEVTGEIVAKSLLQNKNTNLYEGEIAINNYTSNGKWKLSMISISDINSNNIWLSEGKLPANSYYLVSGSKEVENTKKPIVKSVESDKKSYKVGEVAKFSVDLDENGASNVGVLGYLVIPQSGGRGIDFTYNPTSKKYELYYKITHSSYSSYNFNVIIGYGKNNYIEKIIKFNVSNELAVNERPVITAANKEITVGTKFNPLTNVTAKDKEDGNLTSKIRVVSNKVDINKVGTYTVTYAVVDTFGNKTTKSIKVIVNPKPAIKTLTTNISSPSKVGEKITVKATSNINDGQYEFYVKEANAQKWTKLKGMGPKNYAYWTPEKAGEYTIRVRAKNSNSYNTYDCYKDIKFTVYNPIKITSLTTNKPSGTKKGTKITVTAGPKLSDAQYEFYVKDASGKWTKLKGMGPKNYAYWTPEKAGKYTIRVRAKNIYSPNKYDSYKDISFTVNK